MLPQQRIDKRDTRNYGRGALSSTVVLVSRVNRITAKLVCQANPTDSTWCRNLLSSIVSPLLDKTIAKAPALRATGTTSISTERYVTRINSSLIRFPRIVITESERNISKVRTFACSMSCCIGHL
jgi:hypothetical protein